jgi:hypothetical protein
MGVVNARFDAVGWRPSRKFGYAVIASMFYVER